MITMKRCSGPCEVTTYAQFIGIDSADKHDQQNIEDTNEKKRKLSNSNCDESISEAAAKKKKKKASNISFEEGECK